MKHIYLRIENYNGDNFVFAETHNATMDKNFIYYQNFKIRKVDTEVVPDDDKARIMPGRINRFIKVQAGLKAKDPRFIKN